MYLYFPDTAMQYTCVATSSAYASVTGMVMKLHLQSAPLTKKKMSKSVRAFVLQRAEFHHLPSTSDHQWITDLPRSALHFNSLNRKRRLWLFCMSEDDLCLTHLTVDLLTCVLHVFETPSKSVI